MLKKGHLRDHICAVPVPAGICGDFEKAVNILFSIMQWKNISMQFIHMDILLCST